MIPNSSMLSRFRATQKVVIRPLDELAKSYGFEGASVMKIDIEGFELNALRSAGVLLKSKAIRNIVLEIHPAHLAALHQTAEEVIQLLERYGYSIEDREGHLLCRLG